MDPGNKNPKSRNPREGANILSVLSWWWTLGIFKKGYSKPIGPEDLYDPIKGDRSTALGDRLEKQWNLELKRAKKKNRKPSLLWTIGRTFIPEYLILGGLQIFNEFICRLGTPLLLAKLLQYFKPEPTVTYELAIYAALGICTANGLSTLSINQTIFGAFHVGGRIRISICSLVYRKALRLSRTALGDSAPGKIVNLVASDVNRFDIVSVFIHHMWSAPLSALIVATILAYITGYAGLIGVLAVFTVVPIQAYTGKLSSKFRMQTAIKSDERVRLMDEIISGVQVIKMYAWEKPFCALVELARKLELKVVRKSSYIRGIYMTFMLFTTRMALYCTLITMMFTNTPLTADVVFMTSAYFGSLAQTMSGMFVRGFAELSECNVAVKRLQKFLLFDEFEEGNVINVTQAQRGNGVANESKLNSTRTSKQDLPYIDEDPKDDRTNSNQLGSLTLNPDFLRSDLSIPDKSDFHEDYWGVKLENVTAKWDLSSTETTLDNVNLKVEKGRLYCVIGLVGAGKSSLLSSILGEINLVRGNVKIKGSVSYAGQDCWVFGATVRQNILFGTAFDRQRYQKVVKACALQKDFKQFPQGDQTIVGERGSSLSGGQRARINLARAVYRQADIYLLDDPLSAVDAHVGKHLFEECIHGYLRGKTRILATHQLQYIKDVDKIICVDQGKIQLFSNYHELMQKFPEYLDLIAADNTEASEESLEHPAKIMRKLSTSSNRSRTPEASGVDTDQEEDDENPELMTNTLEGTSRGATKGSVTWRYLRAGGNYCVLFVMIVLFILTQCITSSVDYFMKILVSAEVSRNYWISVDQHIATPNVTNVMNREDIYPQNFYIYVYTVLVVSIFVIGIIRSFTFYGVCCRASQRLHDIIFGSLIQTSMRFFDTNPSGRILNRFSKDMGAMDELLPKAFLDATQINLNMCGAVIVACLISPLFVIPVLFLALLFYAIRKVYLKTSKNVKRLEGITRSPVFTHLNATLNGISTIRAYRAQNILKKEFDKLQDVHTSSWYMFIAASTAFGFSLDVFCFLFTTTITFSFLIIDSNFSGGDVGLAITQVMALTGMVQWGMRQAAEVSNQMMSVERILEYTKLPPENNLRDVGVLQIKKKKRYKQVMEKEFIELPPAWPTHGHIDFRNVYMKYSEDDPPVLKGLTMEIQPSEKVGIVGRTGAGKSSLISALFRLANVEGSIIIDGIDTGTIALEDLRKNISIIPQDPVLFSGTLRRNLDPFGEFSDQELWDVLDEVELKDAVNATGHGLENRVQDRGSNYSVGQRQLVCLARAILRNNRVLMLDEATANVDPHTDSLIQRTIRTKFALCTVLTVAHRLNTIMDSDKVLVMDKGRLMEFDHPYILLQKPNGQFTSLVKETGRAMHDQLFRVAKDAYSAQNTKL